MNLESDVYAIFGTITHKFFYVKRAIKMGSVFFNI